MATTWTVVLQPSRFSPHLQPTGFEGTWNEAREAYENSAIAGATEAFAVYLVTTTDTEMVVESGRTLKIAPTAAVKAARKERQAKIDALLARHEDGLARHRWSPLGGFGSRIGASTPAEVAAYAVDNGMDYSALCRTQA